MDWTSFGSGVAVGMVGGALLAMWAVELVIRPLLAGMEDLVRTMKARRLRPGGRD